MLFTSWLSRLRTRCGRRRKKRASNSRQPGQRTEHLELRTLLTAPNPFDLTSLNGSNGFRVDGEADSAELGRVVSVVGDVNGDGFDDFAFSDSGSMDGSGAYVVFGSSSPFPAAFSPTSLDGSNGFRIEKVRYDGIGPAIAGAGDINGDGIDDVIVGDFRNQAFVIFGTDTGFGDTVRVRELDGSDGFAITRGGFDYDFTAVAGAGDVNGDGLDDFVIGIPNFGDQTTAGPGQAAVVFGREGGFGSSLSLDLDGTNGFFFDGTANGDHTGYSVESAGDVNGDGFGDVIIGAYGAAAGRGESYVVFGRSGGFSSSLSPADLDGTNGFQIDGIDGIDGQGFSVSSAGDINGDGLADLVTGSRFRPFFGDARFRGEVSVILGRTDFSPLIEVGNLDGTDGFRFMGGAELDEAGRSVSSGDINGDGYDDVVVGAPSRRPPPANPGKTHVIFGGPGPFPALFGPDDLDGDNGFNIVGVHPTGAFGFSVSLQGDVNGDGFDDLGIGARDENTGSARVVFGSNFTGGAETQVGDETSNTLTANQGPSARDVLIGAQGNDILIGDGGPDVLLGGADDDILAVPGADFQRIDGGSGFDTLRLDGSGATIEVDIAGSGNTSGLRIFDIEALDLRGSGANTLSLSPAHVQSITGASNTLRVMGDVDDTVDLTGFTFAGTVEHDGVTFAVHSAGRISLEIAVSLDLSSLDGTNGFRIDGSVAGGAVLNELARVGDFNGDGFDDIVVEGRTPGVTTSGVGSAYLIFGGPGGFNATNASLDAIASVRIDGVGESQSLAGIGDFNRDGFDDIAIGDPSLNNYSGAVHIILGGDSTPPVLDAGSLDPADGFTIHSKLENPERLGTIVSGAGDIDGDGFDDLAIASYEPGGARDMSPVVIVRGGSTPGDLISGTYFQPTALASPGDVDGDGIDDLLIADSGDYGNYGIDAPGTAFVLFGNTARQAQDQLGVGPRALVMSSNDQYASPTFFDSFAGHGSGAGDFNGDGLADIAITEFDYGSPSEPNRAYVVFGSTEELPADVTMLDGTDGFRITNTPGAPNLFATAPLADINGDDFDDLVLLGQSGGNAASWVVFGDATGFGTSFDLSAIDGSNGFRIDDVNLVRSAGDFNNDGIGDLVIASPDTGAEGALFVVFGQFFAPGPETQIGTSDDDVLTATQGATSTDNLLGEGGNDTLISDGGPDLLRGGDGDDVIQLQDLNFDHVSGGPGTDTLVLPGPFDDFEFDVIRDGLVRGQISGIEVLDAGSDVFLNVADVRSLSNETDTFRILTRAGTLVELDGFTFTGFEPIDGQTFGIYTAGELTVEVLGIARLEPLIGSVGFEVSGYQSPDSGTRLAFGDINGDGFDDALFATDGYYGESAEVFVRFGNGTGAPPDELSITQSGLPSYSGGFASTLSVGDVNGDGLDDVIIGAPSTSDPTDGFVVFGRRSGFPAQLDVTTLASSDGFRIFGGIPISTADVSGDGIDDIVLDTGSDATVVFGRSAGFPDDLTVSEIGTATSFQITGETAPHPVGVGDLNSDGFEELATPGQLDGDNVVFVLDGSAMAVAGPVDLQNLFGGFRVVGLTDPASMADSAGDINGDGFGDLVIRGGETSNPPEQDEVFIIFGAELAGPIDVSSLDGTNGFQLNGAFDSHVAGGGDIDGDGFDDLAIGLPESGRQTYLDYYVNDGQTFVLFGRSDFDAQVDLATEFGSGAVRLEDETLYSGEDVAIGGDINGDGFADLLIGGGDYFRSDSGERSASVAVFGGRFTDSPASQFGDENDNTLTATQGAMATDVLIGGLGNDVLVGDGGADVLRGGGGDDALTVADATFRIVDGGSGFDTLRIESPLNAQEFESLDLAFLNINGIEAIDVRGDQTTVMSFTPADVVRLTGPSNMLRILADANDSVEPNIDFELTGFEFIDGISFARFTAGPVTLLSTAPVKLRDVEEPTGFQSTVPITDTPRLTTAGDINGDGFDDLLVGSPYQYGYDGYASLIFGRESGFPAGFDDFPLDEADGFTLVNGPGSEQSYFAQGVAAGDVNGDGLDDLLLASDEAFGNGDGETIVLFGRTGAFGSSLDVANLDGSDGFRITRPPVGFSNDTVAAADVNGDGLADVIMQSNNPYANDAATFVLFGSTTSPGPVLDVSSIDGTNGFSVVGQGIDVRQTVANVGDVNGDGIDDIGISVDDLDSAQSINDAYIVFGRETGFPATIDLDAATSADRLVFPDTVLHAGIGDINGDGFGDLGIETADGHAVVFGQPDLSGPIDLNGLDGTNGFRLDDSALSSFCNVTDCVDYYESNAYAASVTSLSRGGDINGDGFDDLLLGSPGAGNLYYDRQFPTETSGQIYVVFGQSDFEPTLNVNRLPTDGGLAFEGNFLSQATLSNGSSPMGDINGDGFDDLAFGHVTERNSEFVTDTSVVFGGAFTGGPEIQIGDAGANTLTAQQGPSAADFLIGGPGNDQLVSDGGPDALRGGQGDDLLTIVDTDFRRIDGGGNSDTLVVGGPNMALDLTTIADSRIIDIEEIDLRGDGSHSLTLGVRDVLNISSHSNTLTVRRGRDDVVNIGSGWTSEGTQAIDGVAFERLTQGEATLLVQLNGDLSAGPLDEDGELRLIEPDGVDSRVIVSRDDDMLMVVVGDAVSDFTTTHTFDLDEVDRLMFMLGNGDSQLDLRNSPVPAEVHTGAGNDTVIGSRFDDILMGDDGNDMLRGGRGADVIMGGAGNDNLNGQAGRDTVMGEAGNDRLGGGGGNDRLDGGEGDDRVNGQSGKDRLVGGPGIDRIVDNSGPTVVFDEVGGNVRVDRRVTNSDRGDRIQVRVIRRLTLNGTDNDESIRVSGFTGPVHFLGNGGNDTLIGGRANDTLEGGDGDDVLQGRAGNDLVLGGAGNDRVAGEGGRDILGGGTGDDLINGGGGVSTLREDITGSVTLVTQSGTTVLSGGGLGSDTILGTFRSAQLFGDSGPNRIDATGFNGRTTLLGHGGRDTLLGSAFTDVIDGGDGNDSIEGNAGNDAIAGRSGADNIRGGAGNDTLLGGADNDALFGEAGRDLILGESGADRLTGGPDRDRLAGGGNNIARDPGDQITGSPREINEALRFAFDRLLDGV